MCFFFRTFKRCCNVHLGTSIILPVLVCVSLHFLLATSKRSTKSLFGTPLFFYDLSFTIQECHISKPNLHILVQDCDEAKYMVFSFPFIIYSIIQRSTVSTTACCSYFRTFVCLTHHHLRHSIHYKINNIAFHLHTHCSESLFCCSLFFSELLPDSFFTFIHQIHYSEISSLVFLFLPPLIMLCI